MRPTVCSNEQVSLCALPGRRGVASTPALLLAALALAGLAWWSPSKKSRLGPLRRLRKLTGCDRVFSGGAPVDAPAGSCPCVSWDGPDGKLRGRSLFDQAVPTQAADHTALMQMASQRGAYLAQGASHRGD